MNGVELSFEGDVRVQLLLDGKHVLGIGRTTVGGVELRDGSRPIRPHIDTPEGIRYERFRLGIIEEDGLGGMCVRTTAIGRRGIRGEYIDQYQNQLVFPSAERGAVEDEVDWLLSPASLVLGGRQWFGFSYAWRFRSQSRQVHRLLAETTWELGGRITGNTLLHQGQVNRPVYEGCVEGTFTTCCLKTLDREGDPREVSYQLGPRGGLVQEQALIQALRDGLIAGAALDVFEKEPPDTDNPLIGMNNVVMTPHIGANSIRARLVNVTNTAKNVANILQGKKIDLKYVVNPEVFK